MNATHEEWRPVVGYEGSYEVSDQGRVRSLDRIVVRYQYGKRTEQPVRGRMLSPGETSFGHEYVNLGRGNKRYVHRLVLEAFVGPPAAGTECCHNDGNPKNNLVSNLRWGTRSANIQDAVRHGTHHQAKKTHCKHGHPFTAENTSITRRGQRRCLTCRRQFEN